MSDDETWCVTSSLFVGSVPAKLSGIFVDTSDAAYALRVMRKGATAVVPSFDVAAEVLRLAGRSEGDVAFNVAVSRGAVQWDGTFGGAVCAIDLRT